MHYRSSPLLMFRQFLVLALIALMAVMFASFVVFHARNMTNVYMALGGAFLLCALYVRFKGYVSITVTDKEVVVNIPRVEPIVIARDRYNFSSQVESHSVNLIPVKTERTLKAYNDDELLAILLPNLSKGAFDRLMSSLRAPQALTETRQAPAEAISFAVPKEQMLADYRSLVKKLAIGGVVLAVAFVGFMAYKLPPGSAVGGFPATVVMAGFCVMMMAMFAVPMAMEYQKRQSRIPGVVSLDGDSLTLGDDRFAVGEIRRIVATPPDYGATDWANMRKLIVESDREKKAYHFGIRRAGGAWKTEFVDYGTMCEALENAAAGGGFEFVYDL